MRRQPRIPRYTAVNWTAVLVTIAIVSIGYHRAFGFSQSFLDAATYLAQIFSGNWSPDAKGVGGSFYLIGLLTAVILNVLTVAGVCAAAYDFYFIKRSADMDKLAAFDLRSADQKDRLIELLDDETNEKLSGIIDQAFAEGDQIWKEKTLPTVLGRSAARRFLSSVEKSTSEQLDKEAERPDTKNDSSRPFPSKDKTHKPGP